jgi:O-antigen/teichoic acid export membrane protein
MARVSLNIIANFVGRGWAGLVSLLVVPLYIKFLGIEAYGLVGVFVTLQVFMSLLDLGLNATVNRELARHSATADRLGHMRDLVRTLEVIYWAIALVIGAVISVSAELLATRWIQPRALSAATVEQAIMIMGVVLCLQWPFAFYSGGLLGLQRQVAYNAILAGASSLRAVGAVLVIWLVSPTIQAFFAWQIVASGMQTVLVAGALWHFLKMPNHVPAFRKELLKSVYRFSGGVAAISVVTLFLTQTDKLVLSKLLSLDAFGYYTLASTVSGTLYIVITPVFSTFFPVFAQSVARSGEDLRPLYHRASQLMSVAVLPASLVLAFFAKELVLLWTRNPTTAERTHAIVAILVLGSALNGLMNVPYALQLAYGWTRLTLYSNLVALGLLVPAMLLAVVRFGPVGAASMWLVLNAGYVLITLPIMHRRLLKGELRHWFVQDVGLPLGAALSVVLTARAIVTDAWPPESIMLLLAFTAAAAVCASAFAAPAVRQWAVEHVASVRLIRSRQRARRP